MHQTSYSRLNPEGAKPTTKTGMPAGLRARLGYTSIAALFFGMCALIAMIALLAYVWFCDAQHPAWHYLVENAWLTRIVTLVALVIRIVVSAQASLAVSMIASALLESPSGTRLPDIANVSIMRFTNGGPLSALKTITSIARASIILTALVTALALSSTALQFTSTILLSDFAAVPALTANRTAPYPVLYDATTPIGAFEAIRYWTFPPSSFPLFAEHRNRSFARSDPHDAVFDTGTTVRGLLPLPEQTTRLKLDAYAGYATLVDMRVACVRPRLDELRFERAAASSFEGALLRGYATPSTIVPMLFSPTANFTTEFNCTTNNFHSPDTFGFGEPAFSVCPRNDEGVPGLLSPLGSNRVGGRTFIIVDHTNVTAAAIDPVTTWDTRDDGVWTQLVPESQDGVELGSYPRVTMCFHTW